MPDIFDFCDELGPEQVLHLHEPMSGLRAVLIVDNVAAGPAIGGVRMAPDVSARECFRLARAMTFKNAAAGLPHGGGKAVIFGDPKMPASGKERLVRAFARAISDVRDYIPGPDMGTDERAMAWVRDEIGRAVGLPPEIGGIPLDEIGATGFGLAAAAAVTEELTGLSLAGARVAVQGFGAVGRHTARFLTAKGAILVAAADSRGCVSAPKGLDPEDLIALKQEGRSVADYRKGTSAAPEEIVGVACDIWIPAARPDVVRADNVGRLRARLVLEGANIPITEQAEAELHRRGVLIVPDFIANAGGVICGAVEYHGGSRAQAFESIAEKIEANTREVLERSLSGDVTPRRAAVDLARERVLAAMSYRRRT